MADFDVLTLEGYRARKSSNSNREKKPRPNRFLYASSLALASANEMHHKIHLPSADAECTRQQVEQVSKSKKTYRNVK
jgi:hypothetical protein